ncbi:unnamed protein product [Ilex paraguariensis]|uniref:Embryo surrounding factor 1 brassicaceae domain-containing protein n=1 Tax=Ilex paraguariensis TaxID=185542 RepID=A0ABC8SA52_9AQUA
MVLAIFTIHACSDKTDREGQEAQIGGAALSKVGAGEDDDTVEFGYCLKRRCLHGSTESNCWCCHKQGNQEPKCWPQEETCRAICLGNH